MGLGGVRLKMTGFVKASHHRSRYSLRPSYVSDTPNRSKFLLLKPRNTIDGITLHVPFQNEHSETFAMTTEREDTG